MTDTIVQFAATAAVHVHPGTEHAALEALAALARHLGVPEPEAPRVTHNPYSTWSRTGPYWLATATTGGWDLRAFAQPERANSLDGQGDA